MAPTDVIRLRACLALLQHADDLLFSETLPLHGSSSFSNSKVENSSSQWPGYRGEGQPGWESPIESNRWVSALIAGEGHLLDEFGKRFAKRNNAVTLKTMRETMGMSPEDVIAKIDQYEKADTPVS